MRCKVEGEMSLGGEGSGDEGGVKKSVSVGEEGGV